MRLKTRGDGKARNFKSIGKNVVIEPSVVVIEADHIEIGDNVYIGHNTILNGYYKNEFVIGSNVFISAGCNIYGSCGVTIEDDVGIGPGVVIFGSSHDLESKLINHGALVHRPIHIGRGSDIGAGATIIGGKIGSYTQVGAGALVNKDLAENIIAVGVPARKLRDR